MRLLHVADVHLGASYSAFGELARSRAEQVIAAFRTIPDVAAEERVHGVLIAGDLFDGPQPDPATLAAVRDTLRRLVDLCMPVFMVPGNHDSVTLKLNPYRELARGSRVVVQNGQADGDQRWPVDDEMGRRLAAKHRAYILARPRFGTPATVQTDAGPLHVHGFAYDAAECRDPLATFRASTAPGVHIVLAHLAVHQAGHWKGSGNGLVATTDALRQLGVDYVALGDCHRPMGPEEFDGVPACYPGCFAATDLTDTGARGFVLVDVEPGTQPRIELRDAGVCPVSAIDLDVSDFQHDVGVAEAAMDRLPARCVPVVRLVGEPSFPLDPDTVLTELRERFGHARVVDETRYFASERLDELAAGDTVAGYVVRLGRERAEQATDAAEREVAQRALRVALRALGAD